MSTPMSMSLSLIPQPSTAISKDFIATMEIKPPQGAHTQLFNKETQTQQFSKTEEETLVTRVKCEVHNADSY